MGTKRIKDLTIASEYDTDDVFPIDNALSGTRCYSMKTFTNGIINKANTYVDQKVAEVKSEINVDPIQQNSFNLDYTNVITYSTQTEISAHCDCLFRTPMDTAARVKAFNINGSYLYTHTPLTATNAYAMMNQFSKDTAYADFFLEAGDVVTKTSETGEANYSFEIPLRHGNFNEDMVGYYEIDISSIIEIDQDNVTAKGNTLRRDYVTKETTSQWNEFSSQYPNYDISAFIYYRITNADGNQIAIDKSWWSSKKIKIYDETTEIGYIQPMGREYNYGKLQIYCKANPGYIIKCTGCTYDWNKPYLCGISKDDWKYQATEIDNKFKNYTLPYIETKKSLLYFGGYDQVIPWNSKLIFKYIKL